jgi:hypothetical protein
MERYSVVVMRAHRLWVGAMVAAPAGSWRCFRRGGPESRPMTPAAVQLEHQLEVAVEGVIRRP